MLREAGYPVGVACTVLALSHSSYYYHPEKKDEYELEEAIEQVACEFPKYGTRRVSQQLRRSPHNLSVGRKRVRRIMAQKNLLRPLKKRKKRTTNSEHRKRPKRCVNGTFTVDNFPASASRKTA